MSDASRSFSDALNNDPEVKRAAYEEVKALASKIRDTRQGCLKVAGDLINLDNNSDRGAQSDKWGPQFKPLIQQLDNVVQVSLEQATDACVMMKSITAVFGDVTEADAEDLRAELDNFVQILDRKKGDTTQINSQFGSFLDTLGTFATKIDQALEAANQDQTIKTELQRAKGKLADLNKQRQELDERIKSLGDKALKMIGAGAAAAGAAIMTMNPAAILAALAGIAAAADTAAALRKAIDERARCEDSINNQNTEIRHLLERLDAHTNYVKALAKANSSVKDTSSSLADASGKLKVITDIWPTIISDMQALNQDAGSDSRLSKPYLEKLSMSKDIYRHLILLLETYVEQVRSNMP